MQRKGSEVTIFVMNRKIIILFLLLSFPLYSLEIRLNSNLYNNFSTESLRDLSYRLPASEYSGIFLYELLPLMEEVHNFRFISSDFLMETDPNESLYISEENGDFYLQNVAIGKVPLPDVIEIEGVQSTAEKLIVWFDEPDSHLEREIDLFGRLHQVEIVYRVEKNLKSLLEYNIFNETIIPDLVIYSDNKLNSLFPLLSRVPNRFRVLSGQSKAVPLKLSRQIYLSGSSGGDHHVLTSDFGNLNLLYPLFLKFGMEDNFSINDNSVKQSFSYVKTLFDQDLYMISEDSHRDFIEGKADRIYTSSTLLGELDTDPVIKENRIFPNWEGENPPPVLSYKLMSIPEGHKNTAASLALLYFLSDFGIQQRIDPKTGYLPYDRAVYPYLKESSSKELLMENLENAQWIKPGEIEDRLRFVLPRVYRLIVTGRLTIDEGLNEIGNYIGSGN